MDNISRYSDRKTANTNIVCAAQRAENLAILGSKKVLELCVGPSLKRLKRQYAKYGISCAGNDIDPRWREYYPEGEWYIGDALSLDADLTKFDTVVFAPPLSNGCSGKREDSLRLDFVTPGYIQFLERYKNFKGIKVLVLPGRTLSLKDDKKLLYRLLERIGSSYDVVPLRNKVTKYVDIYIEPIK